MAQISGYKLIGKIGEGGMATVYKGLQISLNRPVAIKVLSKKLVEHSEIMERFKRESVIIARLTNPHIIHVIDRGLTPKGMPYFVMEYVEGSDLAAAIYESSLDFNRKLELMIQVCKALSYAHKNGVIHRDIKPANVLIDSEGHARVLDFGIAQFYDDDGGGDDGLRTKPGVLMGTLPYMSPEQQVSADGVTVLSDIYSLGIVMYEIFTGKKPIGRFKLPAEVEPSIPKPLEQIIMQCLEQEPVNRPASADDIKDILLKLLQGAHLETDQKKRAALGITKVGDKFALLDIIKDTPQGSVFLYEHKTNHNLMVIKRRPNTSSGFMESKLLTSLKHKNIINVLGVSKNEALFIIVMQYLSGGSLSDRLLKPHPLGEFLRIAREMCDGLTFAHNNRIIHGNLRPSNILFSESGQVKITDFALNEHYNDSKSVNWYNVFKEPASQKADVFAAGVIFYQMLTGKLPPCVKPVRTTHSIFQSLPAELQELISRMISRDPAQRPSRVEQISAELDAVLSMHIEPLELQDATVLGPTEFLESEASKAAQTLSGKRPAGRRMGRVLFLLLILYAVGITYLAYTDQLHTYTDAVGSAWQNLSKSLNLFLDETLRPLLEKIKER